MAAHLNYVNRIEGYPVIIRFKTQEMAAHLNYVNRIEGYPVIIRFKTFLQCTYNIKP